MPNFSNTRRSMGDLRDQIKVDGKFAAGIYSSLKILTAGAKQQHLRDPCRRLSYSGAIGSSAGGHVQRLSLKEAPIDIMSPIDEADGDTADPMEIDASSAWPQETDSCWVGYDDDDKSQENESVAASVADSADGTLDDNITDDDYDLDLVLEEAHDVSSSEDRAEDTDEDDEGCGPAGGAGGGCVAAETGGDDGAVGGGGVADGGDGNGGQGDGGNEGLAEEELEAQIDHGDDQCSLGVTVTILKDGLETALISVADNADLRISNRVKLMAASAAEIVHQGVRRNAISDDDMHHRLASAMHTYAQTVVAWYTGGYAGIASPFKYEAPIRRLVKQTLPNQINGVSRPYRPALRQAIQYFMPLLKVLEYKRLKECIAHAIDNGYKAQYSSNWYARKRRNLVGGGAAGGEQHAGEPEAEGAVDPTETVNELELEIGFE